MIIRYFRYLALLGAASSLLNWDIAWGTDECDLQKQGWVKIPKKEELQAPIEKKESQTIDSSDQVKVLEKRISQLEQRHFDSDQLLTDIFLAFQAFQAKQANFLQQADIGTGPMLPRAGYEPPSPPPPHPSFKIPEIRIDSSALNSKQPSEFKITSKNAESQEALTGGVHTQMLAELKEVMLKKGPKLSHDDMILLGQIHRAIELNEFESRFVVKNKPGTAKPQQEDLFSALGTQIESRRKAISGGPEEDDDSSNESWDDIEVCDFAAQEVDEHGEEKLLPELEKFERITQVNRDALLDHNQKIQDMADKVVPMPPRGSNKNEMLVWEWKFYRTPGQKKRINKIVRSYIKREIERLEKEYRDFNPNNAVFNPQRSMLTAPHPTSDNPLLMMSVCFSSQQPFSN